MEKEQEVEWLEAQKIAISEDLVAAAKQQLEFLAAVDRRRCLYDGPVLHRAIHRYKTCWLPLLAKYNESGDEEGPLVAPLDCEWIWHCHRLNPVRYRKDCEEFYGRILDNRKVVSSLRGEPKNQTLEMWTKLFPEEPFELDFSSDSSEVNTEKDSEDVKSIAYDLVAAVRRQSPFYYQVSRPSMQDDSFLRGAVARYKGFLHLIKRNQERSIKRFCVPTYDIDLIWHSHQLQPKSYCQDMTELLGRVLEHDDTDSDRSKGKKLDVGFSETTTRWEDSYGLRYWRAGAMYKGCSPSPLPVIRNLSDYPSKTETKSDECNMHLHLPQTMVVEVLLEIVGIKNFPTSKKGNLFVTFSKKQPDLFFYGSFTLSVLSETGQKHVAGFQCEPTGELDLVLVSDSSSKFPISRTAKRIGTASISLEGLISPEAELSIQKWYELKPQSGNMDPVSICVAASSTAPSPAPYVFHMVKSHPISISACIFPFSRKVQQFKAWTRFMDDNGNEIIGLQLRNSRALDGKDNSACKKEVVGVTRFSQKPQLLAEYAENLWSLKNSKYTLCIKKKTRQEGHIFELKGDKQIKLFPGKKLEYEARNCCKQADSDFITVVEFSPEYPYGKALALLGLKSSLLKVNDEWFVLPGILLTFILSNMFKKEGHDAFFSSRENIAEIGKSHSEFAEQVLDKKLSNPSAALARKEVLTKTNSPLIPKSGGGCGSGCGGKCGTEIKSGEFRSSCENLINSSACGGCNGSCGGGCGGSCKGMANSGSCGSGGCGSCGADVNTLVGGKSSSCGSGGCGSCGADTNAAAGNKSGSCGSCGADANAAGGDKSSSCSGGCGSCGADVNADGCKASVVAGGCGSCGADANAGNANMESCKAALVQA